MSEIIKIPGRLHSVSTEGVVTGANEIYDDTKEQFQSEVNADVALEIADIKGSSTESIADLRGAINDETGRAEAAEEALDLSKLNKSDVTTSLTETVLGKALDATIAPVIMSAVNNWSLTTSLQRGVALDTSTAGILKFQMTEDATDTLNLSVLGTTLLIEGTVN